MEEPPQRLGRGGYPRQGHKSARERWDHSKGHSSALLVIPSQAVKPLWQLVGALSSLLPKCFLSLHPAPEHPAPGPEVHLWTTSLVSSITVSCHLNPYCQEIHCPEHSVLCSSAPGLTISPGEASSSVLLNQTAGSASQAAQGWEQRFLKLKASRGANQWDWEFPNPCGCCLQVKVTADRNRVAQLSSTR